MSELLAGVLREGILTLLRGGRGLSYAGATQKVARFDTSDGCRIVLQTDSGEKQHIWVEESFLSFVPSSIVSRHRKLHHDLDSQPYPDGRKGIHSNVLVGLGNGPFRDFQPKNLDEAFRILICIRSAL